MPSVREGAGAHTYINFVWEGRGGGAVKNSAGGWHLLMQKPVYRSDQH